MKKTIETCPKHNIKCDGFNGYNGNCIVFNGNYNVSTGMSTDSNPNSKSYLKNVQNTLQKGIL